MKLSRLLSLALIVAVSLVMGGCGAKEDPYAGQPKADPNRDNGTPPPRGMNNPNAPQRGGGAGG